MIRINQEEREEKTGVKMQTKRRYMGILKSTVPECRCTHKHINSPEPHHHHHHDDNLNNNEINNDIINNNINVVVKGDLVVEENCQINIEQKISENQQSTEYDTIKVTTATLKESSNTKDSSSRKYLSDDPVLNELIDKYKRFTKEIGKFLIIIEPKKAGNIEFRCYNCNSTCKFSLLER